MHICCLTRIEHKGFGPFLSGRIHCSPRARPYPLSRSILARFAFLPRANRTRKPAVLALRSAAPAGLRLRKRRWPDFANKCFPPRLRQPETWRARLKPNRICRRNLLRTGSTPFASTCPCGAAPLLSRTAGLRSLWQAEAKAESLEGPPPGPASTNSLAIARYEAP